MCMEGMHGPHARIMTMSNAKQASARLWFDRSMQNKRNTNFHFFLTALAAVACSLLSLSLDAVDRLSRRPGGLPDLSRCTHERANERMECTLLGQLGQPQRRRTIDSAVRLGLSAHTNRTAHTRRTFVPSHLNAAYVSSKGYDERRSRTCSPLTRTKLHSSHLHRFVDQFTSPHNRPRLAYPPRAAPNASTSEQSVVMR